MANYIVIKIIQLFLLLILLVSLSVNADDSLKQCTPLIRSCCDLRIFPPNNAPNGVYKMKLGTFTSVDVYYDMTTNYGGWIVIQRNRKNSKTSFYKNWKEYEDGFGDLNEDFWAGLTLINTLTQRSQWEMRVDFQNNDKTWSYLHYNRFRVGSSSQEYPLSVGGYTGGSGDYFTAGDQPANNTKFSTYDNDNDATNDNCAISLGSGSGWWYYRCVDINPNHQPPMSNWPATVSYMEMKIRPKGCTMQ